MTTITVQTLIQAPLQRCFDLAADIGLHQQSMTRHRERVITGKSAGRCALGDEITWEAVHFGIRQQLCSRITRFEEPYFFEDQMQQGAFKSMRHEHHFKEGEGCTLMTDIFCYEVPYGIAGRLFNTLVLKSYMARFLQTRNNCIKAAAEAGTA